MRTNQRTREPEKERGVLTVEIFSIFCLAKEKVHILPLSLKVSVFRVKEESYSNPVKSCASHTKKLTLYGVADSWAFAKNGYSFVSDFTVLAEIMTML